MKPGPRPKSGCASEYHIRLNDDQRQIIDNMGYGKPLDKILSLINQEGDRQFPKTKSALKSRWVIARNDAKRTVASCNALREKMKEFGITDEELEKLDDGEDQDG
jgi:hypothetical protein